MDDNRIPLTEMIQSLKEELLEAQIQGKESKLQFALDSVEVELSVAVTKTGTGKGGIKFWVLEAGGEYQKEDSVTHKFTVVLKPGPTGDIVVSTESTGKTAENL
jgi:hypothetical protein